MHAVHQSSPLIYRVTVNTTSKHWTTDGLVDFCIALHIAIASTCRCNQTSPIYSVYMMGFIYHARLPLNNILNK